MRRRPHQRQDGAIAYRNSQWRSGGDLTSADGTPSPTWEQVVVTGKARARIRRYVRGERREKFTKLGQAMLDRAFRDVGYSIDQEKAEAVLEKFDADPWTNLSGWSVVVRSRCRR